MNHNRRTLAAALLALLGASCPRSSAATEEGPRVLSLREPLAATVRLPELELELGSTLPEVLEAAGDCAREPLGERCNESTFENEMPLDRVRVPAFFLDRTEVTVAAYERCVRVGACRRAGYASHPRFNQPRLPATFVSYDEALAYCRFRGMRLPTEAEFERAARGASRRRFPWGQLYNRRVANHGRFGLDRADDSDGFLELAPVASFPAGRTPEGVYDLAGNVAEWTDSSEHQRPGSPALSGAAVIRGGHYLSAAPWLRSSARELADRELRAPFVGFRCARSAQHQKSG